MRVGTATVALLLAACGARQAPEPSSEQARAPQRESIPCGDQRTCGPDEACVIECECCGIPVPPEQLRASYRCEPLPPDCSEEGAPEEACRRLVQIPCA